MPTTTKRPSDSPVPPLLALTPARERVIDQLTDAFARERIELDVFEHRLTLAHRAASFDELQRLVVDLDPALTTPRVEPPVTLARLSEPETILALCGGVQRGHGWSPPSQLRVVAIMGGVQLDFREARLAAGVTEVQAVAAMGGIHILVPPDLPVDVGGLAIMGGFDQGRRLTSAPEWHDPTQPRLRVSGLAFWGGVHVETRLPGESERQARRRRRRERRALRRCAAPRALLSDRCDW